MKVERDFARPLVPAFLSNGKYCNCFRENAIVGAEQQQFEVFSLIECTFPPSKTLQLLTAMVILIRAFLSRDWQLQLAED